MLAVGNIFGGQAVISSGHNGNHGVSVLLNEDVGLAGFLPFAPPDAGSVQ